MSTVQDSDIILVERSGVSYQCPASSILTKLTGTDLMLVERNNLSYQVSYSNIDKIQDTDLLLIERGGLSYKVTWADIKSKFITFTPSGSYVIDTYAGGGSWNENIATKNFLNSSYGADKMFNGVQDGGAICSQSPPGTIVWRPDPNLRPAVGVTKVEFQIPGSSPGSAGIVYCSVPQDGYEGRNGYLGPAYLNGQTINWGEASCDFHVAYDDPNNPITITSFGITGVSGSLAMLSGIKVNGHYLIEGVTS